MQRPDNPPPTMTVSKVWPFARVTWPLPKSPRGKAPRDGGAVGSAGGDKRKAPEGGRNGSIWAMAGQERDVPSRGGSNEDQRSRYVRGGRWRCWKRKPWWRIPRGFRRWDVGGGLFGLADTGCLNEAEIGNEFLTIYILFRRTLSLWRRGSA